MTNQVARIRTRATALQSVTEVCYHSIEKQLGQAGVFQVLTMSRSMGPTLQMLARDFYSSSIFSVLIEHPQCHLQCSNMYKTFVVPMCIVLLCRCRTNSLPGTLNTH